MKSPDQLSGWFRKFGNQFSGQILYEEPLAKHTYFRIGGPARVLVFPKSVEDLKFLARGISETGARFFAIGQGSNLLISDRGFDGLVIRTSKMNLELKTRPSADGSSLTLITGGSVAVSTLLRKCSAEGWGGLEFLTGVPGLIGGVVRMNAGTHLGEAQSRIRRVESYRLDQWPWREGAVFEGEVLRFEYRKNLFLAPGDVVWQVEWDIDVQDPIAVRNRIQETLTRRKSTQPLDYPSCGSVFKNPRTPQVTQDGSSSLLSAWQVIDRLGLRGYQIGQAQFSQKHSNFILNLGGAKASDVQALIELAKARAAQELGIHLEEEVVFLE